jgi:glycine oxidase
VAVEQRKPDVAVVGAGPIGLAAAWRAAQRGLDVCVLDAGTAAHPPAWHVAAGMLAPVSEVAHGEEALHELGRRAAAGYPAFCAELASASGEDPGLRATGTLIVARDADDAAVLDRLHELHQRLGLAAERLLPTRARRVEPALAPTVRLALDVPGDHSVDPRRLVAALAAAVRGAGGVVRAHAHVKAVTTEHGRVTGVELEGGERIAAGAVVIAAGAYAGALGELPVRPVKGQVLRLRDPHGPGLVARTIRTPDAYLVPRADGRYVLGATMEERGFDTAPTAGGVFELLRDLSEVVPGVLELELEGVLAGLRPATPDNLPAVGPGALDGLFWATGHHRNGILLAGLTGDLVAAALCGEAAPDWARPIDPARFAQVPA